MSVYFPATCIDGFFEKPEYVLSLAKQAEYPVTDPRYPGARSAPLHTLHPELFNAICHKLFSVFYGPRLPPDMSWEVSMAFQKIDPVPGQEHMYPDGWVHLDGCPLAGVVYLNDNDVNAGTALYRPKTVLAAPINTETKYAGNSGGLTDFYEYNMAAEENNNLFEETVVFKSAFNRMVAYDGYCFHAAKNIRRLPEPRYTVVFFVDKLVASSFPVQNIKIHGV